MNDALQNIETIVIVMMENRSFDHMLGYLSLPGSTYGHPIEGLQKVNGQWPQQYGNGYDGQILFPTYDPGPRIKPDPMHDRSDVAQQINVVNNTPQLNGFVQNYMSNYRGKDDDADPSAVMRYYTEKEVPVFDYFAKHYCVCDHWFSALPASTHPNRLMALCGYTKIDDNVDFPHGKLPKQTYIFDELGGKVRWRIYNEDGDVSFFDLMGVFHKFMPKGISLLEEDVQKEGSSSFPQVILIEPKYTYDYRIGNDDHPDASIVEGQYFLGNIYKALRSDEERWAKTLLIIAYDEHGGFFDHVGPQNIPTDGPFTPFTTTGLRVPAFLISPYVKPGAPFTKVVDHTCIPKLLDERFGLNRYPINGRGDGILSGLDEALVNVPDPPDLALVEDAMARIPPRTAHSKYDRAYLAAAKQRAQHYVYIGPDLDGHAPHTIHPQLLGIEKEKDKPHAPKKLRVKRAALRVIAAPDLTPEKKRQITNTHAVTTKQLHHEIRTVITNAQLALKMKTAKKITRKKARKKR